MAITPWVDGEPRFAVTSTARTYICAVERRCSVCGTSMSGPVWRVVAAAEAQEIAAALVAGRHYRNRAGTVEAPGHRICMLYAAAVCPYLSSATARRGLAAEVPGLALARGVARDGGGAVAGFARTDFSYANGVVMFFFADLIEYLPYDDGADLLAELAASDRPAAATAPDYLMADESAVSRRFATLMAASQAPAGPDRES